MKSLANAIGIALALLLTYTTLSGQQECPTTATVSTNGKCADLGGFVGTTVIIDGETYTWQGNIYVNNNSNNSNGCNNLPPYTGTIELDDGTMCEYVAGVLPVELISLIARKDNQVILIEWLTASEVNNDGFLIEFSANGNAWSTLAFVKGAVNSNSLKTYSAVDNAQFSGTRYYRLTQHDIDGNTTVYPVTSITNEASDFILTPNPVVNTLFASSTIINYTIYDANGKEVRVNSTTGQNSIQVGDLTSGVYYISGTSESGLFNQRFIKN